MSELNFKPEPAGLSGGDKLISIPAADAAMAAAGGTRGAQPSRNQRRRFSATRLLPPGDDGFRLFRVF